jgi:hypothetical protein
MDAFDEMRVAQQGHEPHISPSELNAGLSTQEKALIERSMALYSRKNMSGSRDFYEEELFDSVKRKLGLVGG